MATIAAKITRSIGRKALVTRLMSLLRDDIRPNYGIKRSELQKEIFRQRIVARESHEGHHLALAPAPENFASPAGNKASTPDETFKLTARPGPPELFDNPRVYSG